MNKTFLNYIIVFGVVLFAGILGYLSTFWLGNSNPVEQACEEVIQTETGKQVDLDQPVKEALGVTTGATGAAITK